MNTFTNRNILLGYTLERGSENTEAGCNEVFESRSATNIASRFVLGIVAGIASPKFHRH